MKNIKDYNLDELKQEMISIGEKPFRAEQIFKWIFVENVTSFDEMTNLSLELREKLKKEYTLGIYKIIRKQESKDGTKKYLFDILDNNAIETVLMQYKHGYSLCVSSQVGCKMGCKFCASTGIAFIRNLTAGEIAERTRRDAGIINECESIVERCQERSNRIQNIIRRVEEQNKENGAQTSGST